LFLTALASLLLLSTVASRQLTVIRVPDRGDLQGALNVARPGDVLLLAPGGHYTGSFVLPALPESAQAFVTVRTDSGALPREGTRITPGASGTLALIQSGSSDPALRTAPGRQPVRDALGRRATRLRDRPDAAEPGWRRAVVHRRTRPVHQQRRPPRRRRDQHFR